MTTMMQNVYKLDLIIQNIWFVNLTYTKHYSFFLNFSLLFLKVLKVVKFLMFSGIFQICGLLHVIVLGANLTGFFCRGIETENL